MSYTYTVSQKNCHYTFVHNFDRCLIFKILSLLYSPRNLQQNCFDSIVAHSTVVAQDHRRLCLLCCRCESLEHATTGDHVNAVTADFHACIEDGTVSQIVQQCKLVATAALILA